MKLTNNCKKYIKSIMSHLKEIEQLHDLILEENEEGNVPEDQVQQHPEMDWQILELRRVLLESLNKFKSDIRRTCQVERTLMIKKLSMYGKKWEELTERHQGLTDVEYWSTSRIRSDILTFRSQEMRKLWSEYTDEKYPE